MQEKGWRASARKSRGDFFADDSGFAHSRNYDAAFASEEKIHGVVKSCIETREDVLNCLRFDAENAASSVLAHALLQPRISSESCFILESRAGSCARGSAFAPSERAAAGLSCVSRKRPSTPAATAARARGSINSGWPPLAWPCPPGSCTECVASKT